MRKLDLIYYRPGDYSLVPNGSIVVLSDNDQLDNADGAMLASRNIRVCVLTADNETYALNPDAWMSYLAGLRAKIQRKGLTLAGVMVSEEWWDRVNAPDVMSWGCMAGLDMWQRKRKLLPLVRRMVAQAKVAFQGTPIVGVESRWNENEASGAGLWYPYYDTDIVGLDAYLSGKGFDWLGTPPLRSGTDGAMLEKFGKEVTWMLTGSPDGRVTGALKIGRPVWLVAQAFYYQGGEPWSVAPDPNQLQWWWHIAQGHAGVTGLGFFCCQSAPGVVGLDALPALALSVASIVRENGMSPVVAPTPVPVPTPAPTPAPVPTPPPVPTRRLLWTTEHYSDGSIRVLDARGEQAYIGAA